MIDYKNAAGRNWARERRKGAPVRLQPTGETAAEPRRSSVWHTVGPLKNAAGRNWTHEPLPRRLGQPEPKAGPSYPRRERGGGDHDCPYEYRQPTWRWTFPFTEREYARLLVLRSRVREQRAFGPDRSEPAALTA